MKVSTEKIEGSRVVLAVEAPAELVGESLDKAFRSAVRRVNIPGFRRGKAPRHIFERYYGKEAVTEEALKDLIPRLYEEALVEADVSAIGDPTIDDVVFKDGEPITFKATVAVLPEVFLMDYEDISIPFDVQPVTDEDVDAQEMFFRQRMGKLLPLTEDEVLEQGDYASCYVKGIEGGNHMADVDQEVPFVPVGSTYGVVPGLGDALKGMKVGESKEFLGTYPSQQVEAPAESEESKETEEPVESAEPVEAAEPRESMFRVEVRSGEKHHLPSDEELLKQAEAPSLEAFRADIRSRLASIRFDAAKKDYVEKLTDGILEKASVDIPSVMIDNREERILRRFADRLKENGSDLDSYLESSGGTMEALQDEVRTRAEREVRSELILDAIGDKEEIVLTKEAADSLLSNLATQFGQDSSVFLTSPQLRMFYDQIAADMRRGQIQETLLARAAEKAGTPLSAFLPEEAAPVAEQPVEGTPEEAATEAEPVEDSSEETAPASEPVEDSPEEVPGNSGSAEGEIGEEQKEPGI